MIPMAVRSKWAAMAASIWMQCVSGSAYTFGFYSPLLKSTQLYDQQTLDTVALFKDIGANAGVISGAIYSSSPDASCPRLVLALGAVLCFAGYFFLWLSVAGILCRPPVSFMCLFMLLAAHSSTFFNTADVVTAARNFPGHRGTAIGIMKGYLGLSGAILIHVYCTLYGNEPGYFLLMLSLLPTTFALLLMYFVKVYPTNSQDDRPFLNVFSLIALITAGFLMAYILLENILSLISSVRILTLIFLLILLSSPLIILIKAHLRDSMLPSPSISHESLLSADSQRKCDADPEENLNLFQSMQKLNFWLLFLCMACGMGSGLATVNNISQIGSSMGYKSKETAALVSLWSIWNFTGRFVAGYISDHFFRSHGCKRPLFLVITLATMAFGHASIASGFPGALYLGYVVVGVCYGSQWSLMPTISSEIFGLRHFGTIFNAIAIASPCGSYVLSVRVVGYIYDMESQKRTCVGNHCFRLSFVIMWLVSLMGAGVALALFFRTRKFYEQLMIVRIKRLVV
ncbi:protein NUCLEAR FUSION DEFECTIVE 4-like [Phalaenopsis equestris]|uniref:protein NUCLEAR FUSION DEFECTIVE 4-like n=1 Tax=Phalaenopsis equestris TaxID=78828 RepID=UPI0009E4267E|nr:protein NUCLEAR FUSION DEFECTIVE 4-like [Phalaenopsis equestris]